MPYALNSKCIGILYGAFMKTLIEIFDSKQFENIISPISLKNINKVIFVGTKNTMSKDRIDNVESFLNLLMPEIITEYVFVERDNSDSVMKCLENIIKQNENCILDVTGGEDVLLVCAGIFAQKHTLPIIRTNASDGNLTLIYGSAENISFKKCSLDISHFILLQGGNIRFSETIDHFTENDIIDIKELFSVNAANCEAYICFCNFVSEFICAEDSTFSFHESELDKKSIASKNHINFVINQLLTKKLIYETSQKADILSFRMRSALITACLKKSGNVLEYYTAIALKKSKVNFNDIRVGTSVEWNDKGVRYETQNEIDVLAVYNNFPIFISCKNGEVKKEALYELDTVSTTLGGAYCKRILVCTGISKNFSARRHLIERAKDMNIHLIYDVHKNSFDNFLHYLENSVK